MRTNFVAAAALVSMVLAPSAYASSGDMRCTTAPRETWMKIEDLAAKLTGQGYTVREIEFDDGCVEAEVTEGGGARLELYLDPVNGDVVKQERKNKS